MGKEAVRLKPGKLIRLGNQFNSFNLILVDAFELNSDLYGIFEN